VYFGEGLAASEEAGYMIVEQNEVLEQEFDIVAGGVYSLDIRLHFVNGRSTLAHAAITRESVRAEREVKIAAAG